MPFRVNLSFLLQAAVQDVTSHLGVPVLYSPLIWNSPLAFPCLSDTGILILIDQNATEFIIHHFEVYHSVALSTFTVLPHHCVHAELLQSCPTLCDPVDRSPPGSSGHSILQAGILEWVAMPSCRGSSRPRDRTQVCCLAGRFFTSEPPEKPCPHHYLYLFPETIHHPQKKPCTH